MRAFLISVVVLVIAAGLRLWHVRRRHHLDRKPDVSPTWLVKHRYDREGDRRWK